MQNSESQREWAGAQLQQQKHNLSVNCTILTFLICCYCCCYFCWTLKWNIDDGFLAFVVRLEGGSVCIMRHDLSPPNTFHANHLFKFSQHFTPTILYVKYRNFLLLLLLGWRRSNHWQSWHYNKMFSSNTQSPILRKVGAGQTNF